MDLEPLKVFLTQNVFSPLGGFTFSDWMKILGQRFFQISPRYWPRAFFITLMSMQSSMAKQKDLKLLQDRKEDIPDPIFILGHWRSGTTHLHNLFTLDPRWSYPDYISVTQPNAFLSLEKQIRQSKVIRFFSPKTRLIDNMAITLESPMEDEIALTMLCQQSPAMGFIFPQSAKDFDKYLTLRELSSEERETWKEALKLFLNKLAYASGKPAVLKSPPHTARIKWILEAFPKAKFIHVHRNPYEIFSSYKRSAAIMLEMMTMQKYGWDQFDERILQQYRHLYDCFFEDKNLIPTGQFSEISFADLDADPVGSLKKIYTDLGIEDFSKLEVPMREYLSKIKSFSKISHHQLPPEVVEQINKTWRKSFEAWGYPMQLPIAKEGNS